MTMEQDSNLREKQYLNRHRQPRMQHHHRNHQHPRHLRLRHANHRPQVPNQKHRRERKPQRHKHVVERRHRTPADQRHRDPYHIRIPIQRPALHQARPLSPASSAEPLQRAPQRDRSHPRVPIHQPRGSAQQAEIVLEVLVAVQRQILTYRAGQEQDEHDRGGDPERAVEVRVVV